MVFSFAANQLLPWSLRGRAAIPNSARQLANEALGFLDDFVGIHPSGRGDTPRFDKARVLGLGWMRSWLIDLGQLNCRGMG